jgi:hypothetical protein
VPSSHEVTFLNEVDYDKIHTSTGAAERLNAIGQPCVSEVSRSGCGGAADTRHRWRGLPSGQPLEDFP